MHYVTPPRFASWQEVCRTWQQWPQRPGRHRHRQTQKATLCRMKRSMVTSSCLSPTARPAAQPGVAVSGSMDPPLPPSSRQGAGGAPHEHGLRKRSSSCGCLNHRCNHVWPGPQGVKILKRQPGPLGVPSASTLQVRSHPPHAERSRDRSAILQKESRCNFLRMSACFMPGAPQPAWPLAGLPTKSWLRMNAEAGTRAPRRAPRPVQGAAF